MIKMINEEILEFMWKMANNGIIKPNLAKGDTLASEFLEFIMGQGMLQGGWRGAASYSNKRR
jgi:hypothetical protein